MSPEAKQDPRQDLHGAIPAERTAPPLSLFDADPEQVQLFALREECQTDEERAEIDKPLRAYVESELEKVTPLTALFVCFKNNAAVGRADEERIQKDRKRWQGRYDLLNKFVFEDMVKRGKELVTSAAARFRLQDNPVQLEIVDPKLIEEKYMLTTVTMPFLEWKRLTADHHDYGRYRTKDGRTAPEAIVITKVETNVDGSALKAACLVSVRCPACKAKKELAKPDCQSCGGSGLVPASVPGARLKRTSHLRIE